MHALSEYVNTHRKVLPAERQLPVGADRHHLHGLPVEDEADLLRARGEEGPDQRERDARARVAHGRERQAGADCARVHVRVCGVWGGVGRVGQPRIRFL